MGSVLCLESCGYCQYFRYQAETGHNVQRAAAEDGGGAAEKRGRHQEDLRLPSGGGYQEVRVGQAGVGLPAGGLLQRESQPVPGEVLVLPDNLDSEVYRGPPGRGLSADGLSRKEPEPLPSAVLLQYSLTPATPSYCQSSWSPTLHLSNTQQF